MSWGRHCLLFLPPSFYISLSPLRRPRARLLEAAREGRRQEEEKENTAVNVPRSQQPEFGRACAEEACLLLSGESNQHGVETSDERRQIRGTNSSSSLRVLVHLRVWACCLGPFILGQCAPLPRVSMACARERTCPYVGARACALARMRLYRASRNLSDSRARVRLCQG